MQLAIAHVRLSALPMQLAIAHVPLSALPNAADHHAKPFAILQTNGAFRLQYCNHDVHFQYILGMEHSAGNN